MPNGLKTNGLNVVNGDWLKWFVRIVVIAWGGFITMEVLESRDFRNRGDVFTRTDADVINRRLGNLENRSESSDKRLVQIGDDLKKLVPMMEAIVGETREKGRREVP